MLVTLVSLLTVEVCVGNSLLYRREAQTNKAEIGETDETSLTSSSEEEEDSTPSVRPRVKSEERQCVEFEHHYCNSQFGYTHGLFPNNKGQTAEEAVTEFNDFSLLLNSGCSDKLGIFLCFTYFPLCTPNMGPVQEILPCKEVCEEIHKSECTEHVLNATKGSGWAEHFDCNQEIFKPMESQQCAGGESSNGGSENENEICEGMTL